MNLSGADTGVFDGGALLGLFLATVLFEKLMKAMNHSLGKTNTLTDTQHCILPGELLAS